MSASILVCGGAGYIGSHMVRSLGERGFAVTVLDNLSTGHAEAVDEAELVQCDLLDAPGLDRVFAERRFDAVMHFCALSLVGESVREPLAYYRNNVTGTLNLLAAMQRHAVDRLVFSSTAAIFGEPEQALIDESHPARPINPYGRSKWMVEQMLADAAAAHGLRSVSLRYFNAAGASPSGTIGESHDPETHLIPNVLKSVLAGGASLQVFGNDYPTPDGTCVRDYIHVDDLAAAHLAALAWMDDHEGAAAFNLGNGQGFSVLEVIAAARQVTGQQISYSVAERRPGDPAVLVASAEKARRELGWSPRYGDIEAIIETAWRWHCKPRY
ncbi:MAG: UDP-glucose 4-epimerase GalE [Wenzhouxiangella sp.]|nr:MAG: UDP-glucose 4-epimerase GalE [Wenzhouxiangella sp.]